MSENIRRALETHLAAMSPALATRFENASGADPVTGTPYQQAYMLYAEPDNSVLGCVRRREVGIFQVTLCYPIGAGSAAAQARADAIRAHFARGTVVSAGGQNTLINRTPSKVTLGRIDDRYKVVVSIPYSADIIG